MEIMDSICGTCGATETNKENAFCINGHDNWLEMPDFFNPELKEFVKAGIKAIGLTEKEVLYKMMLHKDEQYRVWRYVSEGWEKRASSCGYKEGSKKRREMQLEYFIGAVQAIDCLTSARYTGQTCCPPAVLFAGLRGDDITFETTQTEK